MAKIQHPTLIYCPITGAKHIEKEIGSSKKIFGKKPSKTINSLAKKPNKNRTTKK